MVQGPTCRTMNAWHVERNRASGKTPGAALAAPEALHSHPRVCSPATWLTVPSAWDSAVRTQAQGQNPEAVEWRVGDRIYYCAHEYHLY